MYTKKKSDKTRFQEKNNATLHCQEPVSKLITFLLKKKKNQEEPIRELLPHSRTSQIFIIVPQNVSIQVF